MQATGLRILSREFERRYLLDWSDLCFMQWFSSTARVDDYGYGE